jgi:hypothetical protein
VWRARLNTEILAMQPTAAQMQRIAPPAAAFQAAAHTDLDRALLSPRFNQEVQDKNRPTHWLSLCLKASDQSFVAAGATVGAGAIDIAVEVPIGFEYIATTFSDVDDQEWGLVNVSIDTWAANSSPAKYKAGIVPLRAFDAMLRREMAFAPTGIVGKEIRAQNVVITATILPKMTTTRTFGGFAMLGIDHKAQCGIRTDLQPSKLRLLPQLLGRQSQGSQAFPGVLQRASTTLRGVATQLGGGLQQPR